MRKKLFALMITISLICTMVPTTSFAKWQRRFFTKDGMTWDISNGEAELIKVDKDFKGTIPDKITADDKCTYRLRKLIDEIEWDNTSVTTLRLPNSVAYIDAYAFNNAENIERFETYKAEPNSEFVHEGKQLLYINADSNGLLYWIVNPMSDGGPDEEMRVLVAYPNAKKDDELVLAHGTSNIRMNAFYYCDGLDNIKRIIVQDDIFTPNSYWNIGDVALDVLAKQSNGKYDFSNLTMVFRDLDIKKNDYKWEKEGRENYIINDFAFEYAYKRGMKIDAYIGDAKLKNVVYGKKGKYKPYLKYGELIKLKEGKDYELIIHDSPYPICQREVEICGLAGGCFEGQSIKVMQSVTSKKVKVVEILNGKNCLKAKWKRDNTKYGTSNHIDGYQIGYDKKGYKFQFGQAGPQNIVTVKGYKKTKKIIKNVKKPRKYAVAVRSYKMVDEQMIYGPWSVVYY